jgi:ribose/xylose/arabinose/galactoside ABC-type transport system permease subunit
MRATLVKSFGDNRKFVPLAATIGLFLVVYAWAVASYPAMRDGQAFFNLFNIAPFLICTMVGESFVIISGGIDLSVSGILALTTVVCATLLSPSWAWNPWVIFALVLMMGMVFGVFMGWFITYLKVQPFIATLAGMWLARGLCYSISDAEVRISNSTFTTLQQTKILIPGLADPVAKKGDFVTYLVVVALALFVVGFFVLHRTRFGRAVYAMGGGNGLNEVSSRLMGLPVNRTKVSVYVFSGFCSALAGILYCVYVMSGRGNHGSGFELTTIAACVIGGIALTGGEGYLIGALTGVLITSLIQSIVLYDGTLSSYWVYITIGGLMLLFIGINGGVAAWNAAAIARQRVGAGVGRRKLPVPWHKRRSTRYAVGVIGVVAAGLFTVNVLFPFIFPKQVTQTCSAKPMRTEQFQALIDDGAVIVYEVNGGNNCIDDLSAIYDTGKITTDDGTNVTEMVTTPDQVTALVAKINGYGFFENWFQTTNPSRCGACYQYSTYVKYNGQGKTIGGVDGNTITPSEYLYMVGDINAILHLSPKP